MKRLALAGMAAALCLVGHMATAAITGPIKTEGGLVQGKAEGDLTIFKGIPFAAPPVGDLRWKAPQPVQPWSGVKQTTAFAPACMQNSAANPRIGLPAIKVSEDCLYLNIWTPAKSAGEKLPVMVWIYGGGFSAGSTSYALYDGANLANKGVIVVSIAYRVGPFGFLAHPGLSSGIAHHVSGNYGLLDQIAGLKWVKDNIAAFGGDPNKVTIFGESAGGISVSMSGCLAPGQGPVRGRDLRKRRVVWARPFPTGGGRKCPAHEDAEKAGEAFAEKLGANDRRGSAQDIGGGHPEIVGRTARHELARDGRLRDPR